MAQPDRVRVAAVQFAVGDDEAMNLASALRLIDQAAAQGAQLIVLPEFSNHCAWYRDGDHAFAAAVPLEGGFVAAIAERAQRHGAWIVVNSTVRRRNHAVTGTNILIGPDGRIAATSDKQVLMGNENNFLERATAPCPITETPLGRLGMLSCMDGVMSETPRGLALRGAQILCNTLNSFANDEASLHIPVRAAENKVFVVAANKVGPLVPAAMVDTVAGRLHIAPERLSGAGESQIVAPDGTVLAIGPRDGEAVVIADIDPRQADRKTRPDGTDIFAARRPALYAPLAEPPRPRRRPPAAEDLAVAVIQPERDGDVLDMCSRVAQAAQAGAALIVLPELFHLPGGAVGDPLAAVAASDFAVNALRSALAGTDSLAATSVVARGADGGLRHRGVLVGAGGAVRMQPQLHAVDRHGWVSVRGDGIVPIDLPWGRLALIVGEDALYPESFRLAVLQDCDVVAVPFQVAEAWEVRTGLIERAAENRMSVVAATRPNAAGTSLIIAPERDFTLWTKWTRPFDGDINKPAVTRAADTPGTTRATVHPVTAANREVTLKTNVVESRPWNLLDAIVAPPP
jgi:predicted amidohydrolase